MRLRAHLLVSAALVVAFSCGKSEPDPTPRPSPEPQPPTPSVVAVESVALNKTELNLEPGGTETLTATVKPDNATDKTVTWSTSNAEVATVAKGKVTAVKEGEATITAKAGEKSATCKVTVKMGVIPVESVTLDKTSITLEEDQGTLLTATVLPENATDKTVTWSTSNAEVATVSEGRVTTIKEGEAIITAQAGDKSATCKVTVKKAVVAVSSITLNKVELSLTKGQSEVLVATVLPENATDKTVTWNTSDATIASVTQDGQVTALKSGKADITAKAGEKSATCAVTVTTPVESVSLDRASVSLEVGQSTTLVATISPNDADEQKVEWSTSDATIATVTNGVVTAVAEGNATITAKVGEKSATCAVSVKNSVVVVTSVTLNKSSLSLVKGQNERLTATVNPENATDKTVTWSSSDATIASITQDGQVTALKSGKAVITAKAGEKSATCEVTITTPVESVSLDRSSVSLEEGQTITLIATISPNDADEKTVVWTTSNASVATVSNGGLITAIKEGTATITAKAGGKEATCAVSVTSNTVPVTSIEFSDDNPSGIRVGESVLWQVIIHPENATDKTVTWSVMMNPEVASVDQSGRITGLSEGTATIKAAAGGLWIARSIDVMPAAPDIVPVQSISLDKTSAQLVKGDVITLSATVLPENATDKTVTWSSSAPGIASVDQTGKVTAWAGGETIITAKAGDKTATCVVTVTVPVTSVVLDRTSVTLAEGESTTLIATVNPGDATNKTVTWSTSNASVATVSEGQVTAIKEGTATITAKAGDKSATCVVTVTKPTIPVTSISLNKNTLNITSGQTEQLYVTVLPENATDKTVTWSTSDASVATVVGGLVMGVSAGEARITATCGDVSVYCWVYVSASVVPVTSISLNKNTLNITSGQTEQLYATVLPENATDKTVSWSSSAPSIVSVDQTGMVTALAGGEATIKAKAGEMEATCIVTVTGIPHGDNPEGFEDEEKEW